MAAANPAVRSISARIAANTRWSQQDTRAGTAAARAGFMARFERQVDPDELLLPEERAKRAERAMKAYMGQLALKRRRAA